MTDHNENQVEDSKKSGRAVLMWIVGFFLTFMIVDAFFVYKALSTQVGEIERIDGQ